MTRRFKSTITNWYGVEDDSSIYVNLYDGEGDYRAYIPKSMVENSNDWKEITAKPALVTEDGCEVYDKTEQIWFVLSSSTDNEYQLVKSSFSTMPHPKLKKAFYYKQNAEDYIERKEPKYSYDDLEWLAEKIEMYVDRASDKMEMKAQAKCFIYDLEVSKKH